MTYEQLTPKEHSIVHLIFGLLIGGAAGIGFTLWLLMPSLMPA